MRSGHFLTVLILVGFNLLCVHLYVGFALLQSEYLTVGQASCPVPRVHVRTPSASHFVTYRKLWLLGVPQPPGITVQRQSLHLQTAPCSSRAGAVLWSRAGRGPVLARADYFMAVSATGEVYTLAAVACSELPGLAVPGPSPPFSSRLP